MTSTATSVYIAHDPPGHVPRVEVGHNRTRCLAPKHQGRRAAWPPMRKKTEKGGNSIGKEDTRSPGEGEEKENRRGQLSKFPGGGSPGEREAERKGSGFPEGEKPQRAVEVPGGRLRSPEGEKSRRVESSEGSPPTLVCVWGFFLY